MGQQQARPPAHVVQGCRWPPLVRRCRLDDEQELQVSIWVVEGQGQRAFFTGTCLPKDTPAALQELRLAELEKMRVGGSR